MLFIPIFRDLIFNSDNNISDHRERPIDVMNVCCIGAGYVGGPSCAVMALKCPKIKFNIVDLNQKRIDAWNSEELPIYEVYDVPLYLRDLLSSFVGLVVR